MYRFRAVQHSTNEIKEAWFAIPELEKAENDDPKDMARVFRLRISENPKDALIAENASQAFFMFVAMKDELEKLDIRLLVEVVS